MEASNTLSLGCCQLQNMQGQALQTALHAGAVQLTNDGWLTQVWQLRHAVCPDLPALCVHNVRHPRRQLGLRTVLEERRASSGGRWG